MFLVLLYLLSKPFGRQKSYKNTVYGISSPVFLLLKGQQKKNPAFPNSLLTKASSCCTSKKNSVFFLKRFMGPKFQRENKPFHPQPLLQASPLHEKNKPYGEDDGRIAAGGSNGATCGETATIEITFAAYDAATGCCVFGTFLRTVTSTSPKITSFEVFFFQLVPWNLKHPSIYINGCFLIG